MRSLPNAISISRGLSAVAVVLLLGPAPAVALAVFSLAALTDALDGALARRLRAVTPLGAFLDPLADKVLVLGTLGGLLLVGAVEALPVAAILVRETLITGMRGAAAMRGAAVPSNGLGRAKAALQGAAVAAQLAALGWPETRAAGAAAAVLWAAAATTVVSGVDVMQRAAATIGQPARAARAHAR